MLSRLAWRHFFRFGSARYPGQMNLHAAHACDYPAVSASESESAMVSGERLRQLREQKNLSQTDVEKRTGLMRSYVSSVLHGHTVSTVERSCNR